MNQTRLLQSSIVGDGFETHSPGALLLRGQEVVAMGPPESIGTPADAVLVQRPGHVICPGFVNAHCHLDLSDLEGIKERAFEPWLRQVIRHRKAQEAPGAVEKAVSIGLDQAVAGGTVAVGDICGSERAFKAVSRAPLAGVAFLEFLGHGERSDEALDRLRCWVSDVTGSEDPQGSRPRPGLSPHAPYSTSLDLYAAAGSSGLPVSTHLAESLEELAWCRDRTGVFAELVSRMGPQPRPGAADGLHPLDGYLPHLPPARGLAVHLNYIEPDHLTLLRQAGVTVVYCPRASAFFGHPHGEASEHGWRAMRDAGIPVALGTDGRPCLPAGGVAAGRLSILDEILHLQRASGITLDEWLPMATLDGARALGVPEELVCFRAGARPSMLALKLAGTADRSLDENAEIEWLSKSPEAVSGA